MKLVDMTRDIRPWRAGDSAALPDDIADRLVGAGEAKNPRPWPPTAAAPASVVSRLLRRKS